MQAPATRRPARCALAATAAAQQPGLPAPELLVEPAAREAGDGREARHPRRPAEEAVRRRPRPRGRAGSITTRGPRRSRTTQDPKMWAKLFGALGSRPAEPVIVYDDAQGQGSRPRLVDPALPGSSRRPAAQRRLGGLTGRRPPGRARQRPGDPAARLRPPAGPARAAHATKDRRAGRYQGQEAPDHRHPQRGRTLRRRPCWASAAGHPRGAHLEWSDVPRQEDAPLQARGRTAKLFKDAGIDLDRPSVTHCQSGGRASVMAFTMELMGAQGRARNYYRSWAEWASDPDTPIVTPKKK